jgi:hypothetical protein
MMNKKGQGLSLNVIIVAALALIVLVVLVVVFTGRISIFEKGVGKESQAELIKMKIQYGDCQPTATSEVGFNVEHAKADSIEEKELAKAKFSDEISRCKGFSVSRDDCEGESCKWGG